METSVRNRSEDVRSWKDNIKTNFQEKDRDLDWIDLAGDRGKKRAFRTHLCILVS